MNENIKNNIELSYYEYCILIYLFNFNNTTIMNRRLMIVVMKDQLLEYNSDELICLFLRNSINYRAIKKQHLLLFDVC